jgi:putative two-component system response regulator
MSNRILIVDDEPSIVDLLKAFLADVSTDILGLTTARNVETSFLDFEPDVVLLDLHMPEVDGLEVLRRLGGIRSRLGFVPIIVLTGDIARTARYSSLALGADDFLVKPLDRLEVVLRVRNMLRTRQLTVELAEARESAERRAAGGAGMERR